jgi:hypothetical protein
MKCRKLIVIELPSLAQNCQLKERDGSAYEQYSEKLMTLLLLKPIHFSCLDLNHPQASEVVTITNRPQAVPWLRQLVASLSLWRLGCNTGPVRVGFVVHKVVLGQVFLSVLWFSTLSIILPSLHAHSFTLTNAI